MFINHSTSKNEVIGKTGNGTLIMLYGHVKERYEERLQEVKAATGIEELDFDKLMEETIKVINEYYYECKSKKFEKVRHVIRGEINLTLGKKNFILDISVLIAGSEVTYNDKYPFVIDEQYKSLVESGELMIHDTIIAVETLNTTIRFIDEELENFRNQPMISKFKLPDGNYKINNRQFINITKHMLNDKENKISKCTRIFIERMRYNR
jgi:hypothetical protein